jgi:hypothetical protein
MSVLITPTGYTISHVLGQKRRELERVFESHYLGGSGNSGFAFAICAPDGTVVGGALIGPASSMSAERSIVMAPHRVWCIKRSYIMDTLPANPEQSIPVPESQLLRFAMREVANKRGQTILFVSYADPSAIDERTGRMLLGWSYLASGFMYAGLTSQPRYAVIDELGRARSTRQGPITLTKRNIQIHRPGWQMVRIPAARIWLAVVTPEYLIVDGEERPTTQAWRRRQWKTVWSALQPNRAVAARQWIDEVKWQRLRRKSQVALGQPDRRRYRIQVALSEDTLCAHNNVYFRDVAGQDPIVIAENEAAQLVQRRQAALWTGEQLTRTASPVWVPHIAQREIGIITEDQIAGERTAGRQYWPRTLVANL